MSDNVQVYRYRYCPRCRGSGEADCPHCNGSGYDFLDGGQCCYCNGTGTATCQRCGGSGEIEVEEEEDEY